MTITAPPPGLQPEDYEEIEAAVMETARGRWFLAEYGRRQRAADGERVLDAIARLEARLEARAALAPRENFSAADRLSELAWALRERGVEDFVCGKIDALARDLRTQGGPASHVSQAPVEPPPVAPPVCAPPCAAIEKAACAPVAAPAPCAPAPGPIARMVAAQPVEEAAGLNVAVEIADRGFDDRRRAALNWLDRLPLVDRIALFA